MPTQAKLRVLVIDDAVYNQQSARETLASHDLTVLGSIEDAYRLLIERTRRNSDHEPDIGFDAVLTDLWLASPAVRRRSDGMLFSLGTHVRRDREYVTKFMPAGLIFAICAKNNGVRHVAICSDAHNHSFDRLSVLTPLIFRNTSPNAIRFFETGNGVEGKRYDSTANRIISISDEEEELLAEDRSRELHAVKDWGRVLKDTLQEDGDFEN